MKADNRFLCRLLAEYMRVHALDQKEMAARLEVSSASLSEWLNSSKHGISRKNAERILFVCRDCVASVRPADTSVPPDKIEKFRFAVIAAVMASADLSSESKDTFYQILKNVQVK